MAKRKSKQLDAFSGDMWTASIEAVSKNGVFFNRKFLFPLANSEADVKESLEKRRVENGWLSVRVLRCSKV